jgi:hypothetical protein
MDRGAGRGDPGIQLQLLIPAGGRMSLRAPPPASIPRRGVDPPGVVGRAEPRQGIST